MAGKSKWRLAAAAFAVLLGVLFVVYAAPALAQDAPADTNPSNITGEYGKASSWYLPPDVSKHGHGIDQLIHWMHYFMAVLFVGWGVFFVYCLVKFRSRPGRRADPTLIKAKPAKYAEVGVAIFEAVLLLGFSVPIWASVKNDIPEDRDNPVRVRVMAEQFQWNFHYPGDDGVFGPTRPELVDLATNPLGIDRDDPTGEDDVYAAELHLPVDRPVVCELMSKDVIHSFFIPVMRVKQDTIPGMRIPVWFEAKKGTAGRYEVACAQLCGNNHYSMRAVMELHETEESFEEWLASMSPAAFEEFDESMFD